MNMWRLLFMGTAAGALLGLIYLVSRVAKFSLVRGMSKDKLSSRLFVALALTAGGILALYLGLGVINTVIVILHLVVIWLLSDIIFAIIYKVSGKKPSFYLAGVFALLFAGLYLSCGWYLAHHVVATTYQVSTDKDLGSGPLRVIMLADSHIGATFSGEEFARYTEEMESLSPDIVAVIGDFIDDDTSKEDMIAACRALGELETRYGVYYVYGNHDRGYYSAEARGYSESDMISELVRNHVTILRDETRLIDGRFYLIGREDASRRNRRSMEDLLRGADTGKYMIVLDHQPHDYASQEKSGVDLVLSGHTHGGWLFPFNRLGEINGTDDKTYGREKRSNTEFIVTSGISDWALGFKTGTIAEYVVVDISGKRK